MRFDLKTALYPTTRCNKPVEQNYIINRLEFWGSLDSNISVDFENIANVFLKLAVIISEVDNVRIFQIEYANGLIVSGLDYFKHDATPYC